MKNYTLTCYFFSILWLIDSGVTHAQETKIELRDSISKNRLSIGSRFGFNIEAGFESVRGSGDIGPAIAGNFDRNYGDGFNRIDSSGNANGLTWNWGYNNSYQIDAVNDRLLMNGSTADMTGQSVDNSDPNLGFEFTYARELSRVGGTGYGLEMAFGLMDFDFTGRTKHVTDTYDLGGIIPPNSPYAGSFSGPGPLISSDLGAVPNRGMTETRQSIEAELYGFRLGPYVELELNDRVSGFLSGGLALGVMDSEYRYNQRGTVGGIDLGEIDYKSEDSSVIYGAYLGGQLIWQVTDAVDVFGGAYFQTLEEYSQRDRSNRATIDLGQSVFVTLGLGYRF